MASYYSLYQEHYVIGEGDVWINEPTITGVVIYSIVTPCICVLGIIGSAVTLLVHLRHELKASIYTYLAVLAFADLAISMLLIASGLCKGALWYNPGFAQYDAIIALPLGGFFTCLAISATVFVSIDRSVMLWNPRRISKPKFCRRRIARKLMAVGTLVAILFNIPYCFIYTWNENGTIHTTAFFKSKYYRIHNWIKFACYGLAPCLILILGNGFLIYSTRRAYKMRIKSHGSSNKTSKHYRKARDQRRTTITLIAIIFFFIIGEFPTQFVSRKSAVTILFGGDESKASRSKELETYRQVAIVLNATAIAVNFFLYCMFCPPFNKALRKLARKATMKKRKNKRGVLHADNVQVNVFVINNAEHPSTNGHVEMSPTPNKLLDLLAINVKNRPNEMHHNTTSLNEEHIGDDLAKGTCKNKTVKDSSITSPDFTTITKY